MYQKLSTSGGSATSQWRGSFVPPPPPASKGSRLPSSSSLQDQGCRLKSSQSTNDTRLHAVLNPLSSSPLTSARPHEQARLQRGRHRARSSAARIGAGAAGANASSRNRGSLSSAAPQTVADIAVKLRRKIDQIEATAGGRGGARGRVAASGLEVGFDNDVFGDVEGASGDGMEPDGVGMREVSGVPELDFLDGVEEGEEEESDEYSRQLIIKLTRLAQAGSWERALEVLRDEQTVNMRARAAARAMGEEVDSSSFAVEGMAYNATLAALSKAGQWQEALLLMREMKTRGIERDTISYASVIAACGRGKQWKKALDMLAEMRAEGVAVNSFVYCSAIDACAKGGQWRKALVLLQEMEVLDCLPPNMHCMNSAIDACGKAGRQGEALAVLSRMRRVGIKPNEVSYLSAISACSRVADWQEALRLLQEMIDDGIPPDLKCYSSAIAACGNGGRWNDAVRLLDDMRAAGTAPNVVCYNAAISACGKGRQWQRAVGLLDVMREKGIAPDLISYNAAIDACGKGGRWEEGLQIFVDMVKAAEAPRDPGTLAPMPPVPDATTYGAAITACSRGKQWQIALRLLDDMQERGVTRTEGVFQATLAACAKMGRWRECIVTLDKMRGSGLLPQVVAYNSVITACGRGGEWQRGLAVLQQMSSRGAKPDAITFNAAMTACAQSKQWRQALTILQFMRDPESVPTSQFGDLSLPILGAPQTLDVGVIMGEGVGGDAAGANLNGSRTGVGKSSGVPLRRAGGDAVWPPRPDAVSFHVVIKALASAGMWEKAVEVLEDMEEERGRLLRSDQASVETPGGSNKLWALDIERFRSIFRLVLRGNEIVGEPQMDGFSEEVALRAKAMDVLIRIEKKEQEAGLKRQMAYRTIARR